MFFHQSWLLQQATISLNVYAIHKNSLPLQSDANFCICLGHQCPLLLVLLPKMSPQQVITFLAFHVDLLPERSIKLYFYKNVCRTVWSSGSKSNVAAIIQEIVMILHRF